MWKRWAVFVAAWVAVATVAAAWGGPHGPTDGLAWVLAGTYQGAIAAALVLGTAWGVGGWLVPVVVGPRGAREAAALRLCLGLGALVVVWLGLGAIGLLGAAAAWATVGLAVTRLIVDVIEELGSKGERFAGLVRTAGRGPAAWAWAGLGGFAVLFVAASSPAGALWRSEFGSYDVLSYHLPLAQAWIGDGRVWPVEHSVYSYLPSGMESVYAWAGVLLGAQGERGLIAEGGWRLVAMQHLHAWIGVASVWVIAAAGRRAAVAAGLGVSGVRTAGWVAAGLCAVTPWFVVVGSIAYNELGVVLLGAGALVAGLEPRLAAWRRGVVCGGLIGAACLVKPTAIVLVAPAVGAVMLAMAWRRGGLKPAAAAAGFGAVAGVVVLMPWLVRNAVAADGNAVFPLMTDVLGRAHWSAEQAARWDAAHAADGGLMDRVRLAVWRDPAARDGAEPVEVWRGMSNPQWGVFFIAVGVAGAVVVVGGGRGRRAVVGVGLVVGLGAAVVGWLALTHIQSRFLVPVVPVGAVVCALGVVSAGRWIGARGVRGVGIGVIAVQTAALAWVWASEAEGRPNRLLAVGTPLLLGENYTEAAGAASPAAWVNANLPEDARLLMIGEASVLYVDRAMVWASVWDQPGLLPEGSAVEGGDWRAAWTARVRELGATHLFVNLGEIGRLERSGYGERTPAEVLAWAQSRGRVLRVWQELGIGVIAVRP